ncbi:snRNA-activating protein complex subunit 1 [Anastrepha ludens]|uniref:snRNA-activating protein complex subunit 1 n=1 Tax=Anastrepha ludens TaxID=28586 RepID=UPI0023AFE6B5|nr:snRNA-activating protein complex subunit 1 [Anastrepha ludens]
MESAVFEDCRKLIDMFVHAGNNDFPSFCKQWKALQFQHIYSAQTSYIEIMQTTTTIIHCAKRDLCYHQEYDNHKNVPAEDNTKNTTAQHFTEEKMRRKIGCLYLLYAIYFKQPTEHFIKIEVNLETWRALKNFVDSLPMTADMDAARYVFWRLLEAGAFRFTALNYCVGLEDLVDFDKLTDKENTEFWSKNSGKELGQQLQDFPATRRILPALSVLEDGYNEMKEMLIKTNTNGMHKQSLPCTTIFKSIEQCFQNIQSIIDDREGGVKKQKLMQIENKRRNLKRKGFSNTHDANENDDGVVNEEKSNKYKTLRRMSARTVFTDELPADLLEDLEEQESTDSLEEQETMESDSHENKKQTEALLENPHGKEQKAIEQQLNDLLEAELTEEFITIPPKKNN